MKVTIQKLKKNSSYFNYGNNFSQQQAHSQEHAVAVLPHALNDVHWLVHKPCHTGQIRGS